MLQKILRKKKNLLTTKTYKANFFYTTNVGFNLIFHFNALSKKKAGDVNEKDEYPCKLRVIVGVVTHQVLGMAQDLATQADINHYGKVL